MERLVEDEVYMGQGSLHQWAVQRAMKLAEMDDVLKDQQQASMVAGVSLPPGIQERMGGAAPGLPAPGSLAPSPGGPGGTMPLAPGNNLVPGIPGAPPNPGAGLPMNTPPIPGAPPNPGAPNMVPLTGGRAPGVGIQPNTQLLPGGIPGAAGGAM